MHNPTNTQPDLKLLDGIADTIQGIPSNEQTGTAARKSPRTHYPPQVVQSGRECGHITRDGEVEECDQHTVCLTRDPKTGKVSYDTEHKVKDFRFRYQRGNKQSLDYWGYVGSDGDRNWFEDHEGHTIIGGEQLKKSIEEGWIPWDTDEGDPVISPLQTFLNAMYDGFEPYKSTVGANRLVMVKGMLTGSNLIAANDGKGYADNDFHLVGTRRILNPITDRPALAEKALLECVLAWDDWHERIASKGKGAASKPIYNGENDDLIWHILTHPTEADPELTPLSCYLHYRGWHRNRDPQEDECRYYPSDGYALEDKRDPAGAWNWGIPSSVFEDMVISGICYNNFFANEVLKTINRTQKSHEARTSKRYSAAHRRFPKGIEKLGRLILEKIMQCVDANKPTTSQRVPRDQQDVRRLIQFYARCHNYYLPRSLTGELDPMLELLIPYAINNGYENDKYTEGLILWQNQRMGFNSHHTTDWYGDATANMAICTPLA